MTQTALVAAETPQSDTDRIDPDRWYSPRALARPLGSGTRPIYRAIQTSELRAAPINDRGDLRILGAWAIDWLERLAAAPHDPRDDNSF